MRTANERRRCNVTSSLIGWAHTQNGKYLHTKRTCVHTESETLEERYHYGDATGMLRGK